MEVSTLFARVLLLVLLTPVSVTAKGKQYRNNVDKAACIHPMPCDQGFTDDHKKRGCCKPCQLPCPKGEELDCQEGNCNDHCPLRQAYSKYNSRCKTCEWQGDFKYFNEGVGYKCSQCMACHHYGREVIIECKPDTKGICGGCIDPGNVIINGFTCEKTHLEGRQTTSPIITALSTTVKITHQDPGLLTVPTEGQEQFETNNKTWPSLPLVITILLVLVVIGGFIVVEVLLVYRGCIKSKDINKPVTRGEGNINLATSSSQIIKTGDGVNDEPKFDLHSVTHKPGANVTDVTGASQPLMSKNEDRKQVSMDGY